MLFEVQTTVENKMQHLSRKFLNSKETSYTSIKSKGLLIVNFLSVITVPGELNL